MLRAASRLIAPLRSLPQILTSFSPSSGSPSPRRPPTSLHFSPFSSRRRKESVDRKEKEEEEEDGGSVFVLGRDPESPPQLFVVQPRLRPDSLLNSKLSEALNLANSLEEQRDGLFAEDFGLKQLPPHLVVQNPAARSVRAHADTYFGPGTVENVKCHLKGSESENGIDAVFVNTVLSGIQQRNLEVAWGKPVLDRVGLIIEIFNAHAETKEAKLQSELAALMYKRTRLVRVRGSSGRLTFGANGEAEVVSARGRGSGGRGFISGAGETEIQLQRRRIHERRNRLLAQIEEVRRTRALQRYARKRHGGSQGHGLATVAIVGYTNAGKSTLVSALSQSDLFSDDRLFATVDPRLRSVVLPSGRKTLLSDTVGFISDLPVQLVEAFHATLEEVVEADLLVHVLDSSAPNLDGQRSTVLQVLKQIGVSEEKIQDMIEVWNKIDLLKKDKEACEISDQDECLDEGEDEENGKFSEAEDAMASELSLVQPVDEDDDAMASELLSDELVDVDCSDVMDFELSSEDSNPVTVDRQAELSGDKEMTDSAVPSESKGVQHVETSAVTGIGLAELLNIIDKKLNVPKSFEEKRSGPFDRKWRPSCTENIEKEAEH